MMSIRTWTVPALVNTLIAPLAESPTDTWFAVGDCPATQFKFEVTGTATPAGNTVRKADAVGSTIVTLVTMPVASDGMVQLPCVPTTLNVTVSPSPIGPTRSPTCVAARVSTNRHGVIGVTDDATEAAPALLMAA